MYAFITDILRSNFTQFDVATHVPLRMIVKEADSLNEEERKYLMNEYTHVDFLIYSKIVHQPTLIVEVDGYEFHKEGTVQAERDI